MLYTEYKELQSRGTPSFPLELYHVDCCHPRYQMPLHWHMDCEIIRVLSGELLLSVNAQAFPLQAGDAVFLEGGILHGAKPIDCVYECLVFDYTFFLQHSSLYAKDIFLTTNRQFRKEDIETKDTPLGRLFWQVFDSMQEKKTAYQWEVNGLLFLLFAALTDKTRKDQRLPEPSKDLRRIQKLKQVLSFIHLNFASPLTLQNLADVSGMSPRYFCRFFNEMTGKTPIDYLNYYRVEYAADRLLNTTDHVTEIALASGFNDLSYFVKTFKRYKGTTPKQFRKGLQDETKKASI